MLFNSRVLIKMAILCLLRISTNLILRESSKVFSNKNIAYFVRLFVHFFVHTFIKTNYQNQNQNMRMYVWPRNSSLKHLKDEFITTRKRYRKVFESVRKLYKLSFSPVLLSSLCVYSEIFSVRLVSIKRRKVVFLFSSVIFLLVEVYFAAICFKLWLDTLDIWLNNLYYIFFHWKMPRQTIPPLKSSPWSYT